MCILNLFKKWKAKRRARIYEPPYEDGGVRRRYQQDAPKQINSRVLNDFSCRFSTLAYVRDEIKMNIGVYEFKAKRETDGVKIAVYCTYGFEAGKKIEKTLSEEFLVELDEIIKTYNLAEKNGYFSSVSGLPNFYGSTVDATYESGENIYFFDNQDNLLSVDCMKDVCRLFGLNYKTDE